MNEPNTPTPDLEHVAQNQTDPRSNAQISQSIYPASTQNPNRNDEHPQSTIQPPTIQQLEQQFQARPVPSSNTPKQRAKSVLIIEDERFISELYTRALQKQGYRVDTESDGLVALEVARRGRYDIILLDIMLPSMNGIDLLHALKDTSTPGGTISSKIVITTNMDQPEETKGRVERLADGYLIKAELTPKELITYIEQL